MELFIAQLPLKKGMTCDCGKLGDSRCNRLPSISVYQGDRKHHIADLRRPVIASALSPPV